MAPNKRVKVGLGAAILIGAWLRFHAIGSLSLWFDEGYTAWAIDHRPVEIIRLLRADTAPPLYYLVLHEWTLVFGRSEAALRSLSAVLGVATIPLVWASANRLLHNPAAALWAAWLFVFSFLQTWYSQEARGYEMTAFLAALLFYCLLRHLERPRWEWIAGMVLAGVAGIYTNNFMFLYAGAIGAAGLILPGSLPMRGRRRDLIVVGLLMVLAYLPWINALRSQIHRVNEDFWIVRPTVDSVCLTISQICGVGHFWSWDKFVNWIFSPYVGTGVPCAVTTVLGIGIVIAMVRLSGANRRVVGGLTIVGLLPPLAAALVSEFQRPIFLTAAFLSSTVFMPILIAGSWEWIKKKNIAIAIGAVAMVLCAVNQWAYLQERTKEDWRQAANAVEQMPPVQKRLLVFVANEGELPFDYYYHLRPGEVETGAPAGFFAVDPPRTQRRVLSDADLVELRDQLAGGHFDEVVLIDAHGGWLDKSGVAHPAYSDPDARTARLILGSMREIQRIDLPNEPQAQAITIWRCVPR